MRVGKRVLISNESHTHVEMEAEKKFMGPLVGIEPALSPFSTWRICSREQTKK